MNSQETETEVTGFARMQGRVDFEAAVIVFQDKIPESDRKEFNLRQWVAVWKNVLPDTKIKNIAWKEISRGEAPLADWVLVAINNDSPLKDLALDKIVELVSGLEQAAGYYWQVSSDEARKKKLLDKISAMEASFGEWSIVFKESVCREIRNIAFAKMKASEQSTFDQWAEINEVAADHPSYKKESFEIMARKAKSFNDWDKVREKVSPYNSLEEKALKEMAILAKSCGELTLTYLSVHLDQDLKKEIADRILKSSGEFEDWAYLNQSVDEGDNLKQLSLDKMKKTANRIYHWDIVFHKATSESDKKQALLKMIELVSNIDEAKHAYAHAPSVSLGKQAINKMKEISNKLAGTE